MVSEGAGVRVKEKNRLIRVDQIDEKKGTFRGVELSLETMVGTNGSGNSSTFVQSKA